MPRSRARRCSSFARLAITHQSVRASPQAVVACSEVCRKGESGVTHLRSVRSYHVEIGST
jgi:hypothetical protein